MVTRTVMNPLLSAEDEARLMDAIREVESRTSAEIRICITPKRIWRHQRHAWRIFERAGMRQTRHRNAALIVMMPRVKQIVVIGDSGLDAIVGQDYWRETVDAMVRRMHSEGALAALLVGLRRLGDTLASHWPREADNPNELADDLIRDS